MRDLYEQAILHGRRLHRVSHYLLGNKVGQLGGHFARWATAGVMSPQLRVEITAYQLCVLDDSFVEGPHARISRDARAVTRPSPSWWGATLRLEQNLATYDRAQLQMPGRFAYLFARWKLMAQHRPLSYERGVIARLKTRPFLQQVYRTGARQTQASYGHLQSRRAPDSADLARPKGTDMEPVIKEWLLWAFRPGAIVEVTDTRFVSSEELVSGHCPLAEGGRPLVSEVRFYQVVSRTLVGKRFLSTATLEKMRLMRVPLVLQRLAIVGDRPGPEAATALAHLEGVTEVADLKLLGSWADMRRGLRIWSLVGAIHADGALELVDPQLVRDVQWRLAESILGFCAMRGMGEGAG